MLSECYQMMLGVAYLQINSVECALFHLEDTEHLNT